MQRLDQCNKSFPPASLTVSFIVLFPGKLPVSFSPSVPFSSANLEGNERSIRLSVHIRAQIDNSRDAPSDKQPSHVYTFVSARCFCWIVRIVPANGAA